VWEQHRKYAEQYGCAWVILSAKYGFISPDTLISDYDASFILGTQTVQEELLRSQAEAIAAQHKKIVCLGSSRYNAAVEKAFDGLAVDVEYPLAGLTQLLARQWVIHSLPEPDGGRDNETYKESSARKRRTAAASAAQGRQKDFSEFLED
jgi:hypothetical protein